MTVGLLKEVWPETRVSLTPEVVAALSKKGVAVWVEPGAGHSAFAEDAAYEAAGAHLHPRAVLMQNADVVLAIHPPAEYLDGISGKPGQVLIGQYNALAHPQQAARWAASGATVFSLDLLPRTTRAQAMDVLSSQANIAGYKAVLLAANAYSRYMPMFMTAAGSVPPAKVLILGAGVAGLQAIATARRLGAVVEAFDTRPAVKEEVGSLGAKFIEVEGAADASAAGGYAVEQSEEFKARQAAQIAAHVRKSDIVITTAQIPGKPAPLLIPLEVLETMRPGSVVVDLAAASGGNCALSRPDETVVHRGITIFGPTNLPATTPADASKLYGKNVSNFLQLLLSKEGSLQLPFEDELVNGACLTHNGQVHHPRVAGLLAEP